MMKHFKLYLVALLVLAAAAVLSISGCPKSGQSGGAVEKVTPPPTTTNQEESGAAKTPETTAPPEAAGESQANGEMGEAGGESTEGGESNTGGESDMGGESAEGSEAEEAGESAEAEASEHAGESAEGGESEMGGEDSAPAGEVDGFMVYKEVNCTMCHGADRAGTTMAPALTGLEAYWDVEKLSQYLRDPETYAANDARLKDQDEQYDMQMPDFEGSDEELAALAAWLLKPPPPATE